MTRNEIAALLEAAKADPSADYAVMFLENLLECLDIESRRDPCAQDRFNEFVDGVPLAQRLAATPLPAGSAAEVVRVLDEPRHYVRNGLILLGLWRRTLPEPPKQRKTRGCQ